jgi:hypothetical protein
VASQTKSAERAGVGKRSTENERLLACYRSGQMTERQWQEHLKDPGFKQWVNAVTKGSPQAGLFRFRLVSDWRDVLKRAWSVRLIALAFLLTAVEVLLPYLGGWVSPGVLGPLAALSTAGAFVARLMAQKGFEDG